MNNKDFEQELPALSQVSLPTKASEPPMLTVDFGKKVNITFPKSEDQVKVAEFINKISPLPREERVFNAKIGNALATVLSSRGIKEPVCVKSNLDINVSFDDVMDSDDLKEIIDIMPDEEEK